MPEELTNRSDLYILAQMESAVACGDVCLHKRLATEMRRRLYQLRMEQVLYHIDGQEQRPAERCDA